MTITTSDLEQLARSRGGTCLGLGSGEGERAKYVWQCPAGHRWEATPTSVLNGHWCPDCRKNNRRQRQRETS
jgi:hypothetical protein